jgi:hypothetical protein
MFEARGALQDPYVQAPDAVPRAEAVGAEPQAGAIQGADLAHGRHQALAPVWQVALLLVAEKKDAAPD